MEISWDIKNSGISAQVGVTYASHALHRSVVIVENYEATYAIISIKGEH